MRLINEEYTRHPFYGSRKMVMWLRSQDHEVNRKRIRRRTRRVGLQLVAPKPNTSRRAPQHELYPYLLRRLEITRPNQVWCTDITYIRLAKGSTQIPDVRCPINSSAIDVERVLRGIATVACVSGLPPASCKTPATRTSALSKATSPKSSPFAATKSPAKVIPGFAFGRIPRRRRVGLSGADTVGVDRAGIKRLLSRTALLSQVPKKSIVAYIRQRTDLKRMLS